MINDWLHNSIISSSRNGKSLTCLVKYLWIPACGVRAFYYNDLAAGSDSLWSAKHAAHYVETLLDPFLKHIMSLYSTSCKTMRFSYTKNDGRSCHNFAYRWLHIFDYPSSYWLHSFDYTKPSHIDNLSVSVIWNCLALVQYHDIR